jgi:hypothetical protein
MKKEELSDEETELLGKILVEFGVSIKNFYDDIEPIADVIIESEERK